MLLYYFLNAGSTVILWRMHWRDISPATTLPPGNCDFYWCLTNLFLSTPTRWKRAAQLFTSVLDNIWWTTLSTKQQFLFDIFQSEQRSTYAAVVPPPIFVNRAALVFALSMRHRKPSTKSARRFDYKDYKVDVQLVLNSKGLRKILTSFKLWLRSNFIVYVLYLCPIDLP